MTTATLTSCESPGTTLLLDFKARNSTARNRRKVRKNRFNTPQSSPPRTRINRRAGCTRTQQRNATRAPFCIPPTHTTHTAAAPLTYLATPKTRRTFSRQAALSPRGAPAFRQPNKCNTCVTRLLRVWGIDQLRSALTPTCASSSATRARNLSRSLSGSAAWEAGATAMWLDCTSRAARRIAFSWLT